MGLKRYARLWFGLLCLTAPCTGYAIEPEVTASDLPRVPATPPERALQTFRVKPGFEMQLVASEPLVMDPVAMDIDEQGRLWVAEMRDYSERREERLGRIRMLVDTDGDGTYDKSFTFAENLPWPTALLCIQGGVLVGTTPDVLFLKDTNGDHRADVSEVWFTGFAVDSLKKLNVQALLNSFHWGLDNRVHGSASVSGGKIRCPKKPDQAVVELRGTDFSFDPRTLDFRAETGGGQHGMSFNNEGRKFLCSNSDHLQYALWDIRYATGQPGVELPNSHESIALDGPAAEVYRISPEEPWRVLRTRWRVTGAVPGMIEGGGRSSGYFTGATGATIYRGNAFPSEYLGDAFVADCGSNLIHHKKVREVGIHYQAERAPDEAHVEFVACTDNWFRPVQFFNAPDGTLYVIDMYREIIEHPWSLPESIKKHLDLNSGNDRGRIYRMAPTGFHAPPPPRLDQASPKDWVALLEHPNGWHRDTAARLLVEKADPETVPAIEAKARHSLSPLGRLHALWVLQGLHHLSPAVLQSAATDSVPWIREQVLKLVEPWLQTHQTEAWVQEILRRAASDPNVRVRYQLAWTLSQWHHAEKSPLLQELLRRSAADPELTPPILNALDDHARAFPVLLALLPRPTASGSTPTPTLLAPLARMAGAVGSPAEFETFTAWIRTQSPSALTVTLLSALAQGLNTQKQRLMDRCPDPAVKTHLDWARTALTNPNATPIPELTYAAAAKLMGYLPFSPYGESLLQTAPGSLPDSARNAWVQAISTLSDPSTATRLLQNWRAIPERVRSELLSVLLRKRGWIPAVLEALERGALARTEITASQLQQLRSIQDPAIQSRVQTLLGSATGTQRQETINRFLPSLAMDGERALGETIYEKRCMNCHRYGGKGRAVGPDLESVRSMGKEKLLTQILDPNREVAPQFIAYTATLKSDESVVGRIVQESPDSITLRGADGNDLTLQRNQILKLTSAGTSLMPEGLEEGLSSQDIAGLLNFLTHDSPKRQ